MTRAVDGRDFDSPSTPLVKRNQEEISNGGTSEREGIVKVGAIHADTRTSTVPGEGEILTAMV